MNEKEYKDFYDKVGKTNGWDFNHLRVTSEGVAWDFYEEVTKSCNGSEILLDIGTGGGENLLKIAFSFFFGIGIDISDGMLETAHSNLKKTKRSNVRFFQMSSDQLQFPSDFFDIISCCHAPFFAREAVRVIKREGYFFTQQVSEADKLNLKRAFHRGQAFGEVDGTLKNRYVSELKEAGFRKVESFDYDAVEYYERPEDLLFLLKHTPIIPYFDQNNQDFDNLHEFIENNWTPKGIQTNSKRFMIVAAK